MALFFLFTVIKTSLNNIRFISAISDRWSKQPTKIAKQERRDMGQYPFIRIGPTVRPQGRLQQGTPQSPENQEPSDDQQAHQLVALLDSSPTPNLTEQSLK
ncbi:hypothetical protein GWI33_017041 [Rhynchophorus ferrugineus]|uniref:Uncharacterized protein n=1 Tax=Rhynchophorus ferrugineus TaxID=354439 RepID=A0A834M2R9_RHYFE|nr:hypothetical protein GWI33_017041 [Rhynchophorus ferrugineus]